VKGKVVLIAGHNDGSAYAAYAVGFFSPPLLVSLTRSYVFLLRFRAVLRFSRRLIRHCVAIFGKGGASIEGASECGISGLSFA